VSERTLGRYGQPVALARRPETLVNFVPRRTLPCACGGWISAIDGDGRSIVAAVRAHQASPIHRVWREEEDGALGSD
jgi:hypothetical protein